MIRYPISGYKVEIVLIGIDGEKQEVSDKLDRDGSDIEKKALKERTGFFAYLGEVVNPKQVLAKFRNCLKKGMVSGLECILSPENIVLTGGFQRLAQISYSKYLATDMGNIRYAITIDEA